MSNKRKRRANYDSRLSRRAIELFQLAMAMLQQGYDPGAQEMNEVACAIHRNLGLKPWMEFVIDFECFTMTPTPGREADFALVEELHRRLVEERISPS
jgi:hypothetical protein